MLSNLPPRDEQDASGKVASAKDREIEEEIKFTPEQIKALEALNIPPAEIIVLRHFARNYLTGRRVACFSFRAIVALGSLVTALMAIGAGLHELVFHSGKMFTGG